MPRFTTLAALLALAAPAHAATIELRAGPVSLAPGQVACTLVSNAGTSPCNCRAVLLRCAAQEDGFVQLSPQASAFSLPAAQMREVLQLTLETAASRTGPALVSMQGTE